MTPFTPLESTSRPTDSLAQRTGNRLQTQPSTALSQLPNLSHGSAVTVRVAAQHQANLFLLNLRGHQLAARSDLPLTVGERLVATVDRSGPGLLFRLSSSGDQPTRQPSTVASSGGRHPAIVDQALRWALPRQQPLNELLSRLRTLPSGAQSPLLINSLKALLLPSSAPQELLQPGRLVQAINNSGVLLEHNLLKRPTDSPTHDIKANLLRTLQAATASISQPVENQTARQVASQLHEITTSALARVESQQLATINDESGRRVLTTDLVLKDAERASAVEIEINKEPSDDARNRNGDDPKLGPTTDAEHRWQVTLKFDLPGIGKLESHVRFGASGLRIDFRADQTTTLGLLGSRFDQLTERLRAAGMTDSHLTATPAPQPTNLIVPPNGAARPLIDLSG